MRELVTENCVHLLIDPPEFNPAHFNKGEENERKIEDEKLVNPLSKYLRERWKKADNSQYKATSNQDSNRTR